MLKLTVFILLSSFFIILTSCSIAPERQEEDKVIIKELEKTQPIVKQTFIEKLELGILRAQKKQDWIKFIDLSQQLWGQVDSNKQALIEKQIYTELKQLNTTEQLSLIKKAKFQENIVLEDWLTLIKIRQQAMVWQKIQLNDLKIFNENAIYHQHLLPEIIRNLDNETVAIEKIAVLLPLSGSFAKVGQQIRNGILKNQLHSQENLTIKFYDSSDLTQLTLIYQQAKNNGAEKIIGPLKREAINILAEHQAENLMVLNQIENSPFIQFSFNSLSEASQITNKLNYLEFKNIAILSNKNNRNINLAQEITSIWNKKSSQHHILLQTYSDKKPNFREVLGGFINESTSRERHNNLRWLLNKKLEFTPRSRQDLDAIIILDKVENIAVFKPQMRFFGINPPVFTSSRISPANFTSPKLYPDLRKVMFLTSPAVLNPQKTTSAFESFGWDSLTIATKPDSIIKGLCTKGQKGLLTRVDSKLIASELVWARFNRKGQIVPLTKLTSHDF